MVQDVGIEDNQPSPVRRTTVAEAAELLGISAEAVRGRIRRGTLPVERDGGTVYVLLEGDDHARTTADQLRTTADQPDDRTDLLIAELQDRIRSLEEANRENRRIIAALTQRIPQLEAPRDERGSPDTLTEEEAEQPRSATGGAQEGAHKPWWRRLFGG
jgi:excisionase family DNA binding protein